MFECFVRSRRLFVCQSLHTLKTQLSCMDVEFHSNLWWEGHGFMSGSLLLVIWRMNFCFIIFLWGLGVGMACFGILFNFFLTSF